MKKVNKKYTHTLIATDTVLFSVIKEKLCILLIKMNKAPFENCWAVPGGLVESTESVDYSAKRILLEKAGVEKVYTEQLYAFGKIDRDPFGRVVSVAYLALTPNPDIKIKTTDEYKEIKWFQVDDLPKLAYDHNEVVAVAITRLRSKMEYTNIIFQLLPREFSMSELQKAYEIIREGKLDKRNFQKKIFKLDLVKKLDRKNIGQAHRPAQLFMAKEEGVVNVNIL